MENNYLLESFDSLSLKNKITELINDNNFKDAVIDIYNLEEQSLSLALESLDTYGLFSNKKVIIIDNIESFSVENEKESYNHLINYLDNFSTDNLLIITAKKLNNTKKITKELKKKMNYQKLSIDTNLFIKNELKDYKLESDVIKKMLNYCGDDITKIHNECLKLKNYKYKDKNITLENVDDIVIKKNVDITNLTFEFIRFLAQKDKKNSLKIYKELEDNNIEAISLLGLIASQIRIIYQVKILSNRKFSDNEIKDILNERSSFRIKKTRELINYYTEDELLKLMQELAKIDIKMKTSDIDPKFLIDLFIINF